ncbi:PHD finger protein 7, partial [Dryobates pubescens]
CMLCHQAELDLDTCGIKVEQHGICAHVFCLFFADSRFQKRPRNYVHLRLFRQVVEEAAQKVCFVCHQNGATITCWETGCDCSFHLPCATQGGCVTQYFGFYRSFCREHRPQQAVDVVPKVGTTCFICLEPVDNQTSYRTMVCPACKHTWFHRDCIQNQAVFTGARCFCCPCCKNEYKFSMEMLTMGIRVPQRPLSWENLHANAEVSGRHSCCDSRECLCPGGREQAQEEGPWQLLLCCSCAAEGTHRRCAYLRRSTASWECDSC